MFERLKGEIIVTIFGTAALIIIYGLFRAVFG
jgi:hypothetical protein